MKAYCSIRSRDWRGVRRLRMHGMLAIPPPSYTDPIVSATRVASKKVGVRQQRSTRLWMSAGCPTFPPLCSTSCSFSPYHPHFSVVPIYTQSKMSDRSGLKKLNHEDYVVGWICPLRVEYTAALIMLDEQHEPLGQDAVHLNIYTLGSVNSHNVVLATLPNTGNCPAATVMTSMRHTFQELRFFLLVGIGGGIPRKWEDEYIRLGDVIVGKPIGRDSGVIQHDRGKFEASGFTLTGSLPPPPPVLLAAAQTILSKRDLMDQDPLLEHVGRIKTSKRRLARYRFPGRKRDHVYEPSYTHLIKGATCEEAKCDPSQRISRPEHAEDSDPEHPEEPDITIHHGTVLSGEMVMKSGEQRDKVAGPLNAICYECEAAGTLTSIPSLVIRGVSDYADSHKNDDWHGYASAVAAAYARELFFHMPIRRVKECYVPSQGEDILPL